MKEQPAHDRRSFLKSVGVVGGTAALLSEIPASAAGAAGPVVASSSGSPSAADEASFMLYLDGVPMGRLLSALGGMPYGDVKVDGGDEPGFVRKHIGGVKYEDFQVTFSTGIGDQFHKWVADTLGGKADPLEVEVVAVTRKLMTHSKLEFHNALITEVGFPALDAGAKDACKMTVKMHAQSARFTKKVDKMEIHSTQRQKAWLCSNFRLKIDGLDCSRVMKIDSMTVKQAVNKGDTDLGPSNLVLTLPDAWMQQFYDWFDQMVKDSEANEKGGSLEWLAPDLNTVLGRLDFSNLGLYRITPVTVGEQNSIRRLKCEMYCENIKYSTFLPS